MKPVIVHVNQHVIKHNAKNGTTLPTLTVKHPRDGTFYAHEVSGSRASVVDSNSPGRKPLDCGARVWIEYDRDGFAVVGDTMRFRDMATAMKAAGACS